MARSKTEKIVYWIIIAPFLFHGILIALLGPAILLRGSLNPDMPPGGILYNAYAALSFLSTVVVVWWAWRVFCGDPPRRPQLPSRRAVAYGVGGILAWLALVFGIAVLRNS